MLTTDQRLSNLEGGIVAASEKMHRIVDDGEIDTKLTELRHQLTELYTRVRNLDAAVLNAYEVLKIAEGE